MGLGGSALSGVRVSTIVEAALAAGLGAELRTKPWVDRAREVVATAARLPAVTALGGSPLLAVSDDRTLTGSSGATTANIFGSTLDPLAAITDGILDLTYLQHPTGLGLPFLAPLASPAASENPAAAFVASGAAADPALCQAFAETMREDGLDAIIAVKGVSTFLTGAICSSGLGVYRSITGSTIVDPEAALGLSQASLVDSLSATFAEAGRRLSLAARSRPTLSAGTIAYNNIVYALALADHAEAVPSLATRVLRLAVAVSQKRGGTTTAAEVLPLILAASICTDVLYFAPPSLASAPAAYELVVKAFATAAQPGLRPLRGLPASADTVTVRSLIRAMMSAPAQMPLPLPPAPASPSGTPAAALLSALLSPGAGVGAPTPAPANVPALAASPAPAPAPSPALAPKEVCGLWKRGACRFGDKCRFYHDPQFAPDKK